MAKPRRKKARVWKVKVIERKLGRERAWGQHEPGKPGKIELDPRMKSRHRLLVMCHELLHEACPEWPHARVYKVSGLMARTIWSQNWREIRK